MLLAGLLTAHVALAQIPSESWPPKPPVIPPWVKVTRDLSYGTHPRQVLNILQPTEAARSLRPAAIVIHGGGWIGGTRDWVAEHVCLRFVEIGFVVANVEYRVAPAATAPAAVEDVLLAAAWFKQNARRFGADPRRLVVTGDSAGGHLALMVGLTPKSAGLGPDVRVGAVVNFFGITDVNDQLHGPNQRNYTVQWVPEQPDREALARRVSPLTYARKGAPPVLSIHGTADSSVPYQHAVQLTERLNAAGATAALITVAGGSHGFSKNLTDEIYERYVWPFLRNAGILKGPDPQAKNAERANSALLTCGPPPRCKFAGR